ncbi:putative N-acetylmannosamine-6-phosphate 2-epimerase, partial [termite gut metagenome]
EFVVKMAIAAQWGGAVGIRANSPEQILAIKKAVDLPVIGLWKIWHDDTDVFITPTLDAAKVVLEAGADIVALDCTEQITHEGRPAYELLPIVRKEYPETLLFADVSTYEEGVRAIELGADIVGPTLYGYTEATKHIEQPDLRDFACMCRDFKDKACVIMEGHIYTPEDAMKCIYLGAHAVVVGSAITRPHLITKRFVDLLTGYQSNWRETERSKH